ncbi:hypothetical protein VTK73DRAFT_8886 [Phialemonium thermophilum]|uniref:Cyclic nucleotide-binding domain-containing protein n=1 Tax=Phialemonium thermophilum TaxID=223376 RepID=A0ABR3XN75_9PEZI
MSSPFSSWGRRRTASLISQDTHDDAVVYQGSSSHASPHALPTATASSRLFSSSFTSSNPRQPTRSFINSSVRDQLSHVDSTKYAQSVREDTAELARYLLSDNQSRQGSSFMPRARSHSQSSPKAREDDHIHGAGYGDAGVNVDGSSSLRSIISGTASLGRLASEHPAAEGPSILAEMLRSSSPTTEPVQITAGTQVRDNETVANQPDHGSHGLQSFETLAPSSEPVREQVLTEADPLLHQAFHDTPCTYGTNDEVHANIDLEDQKKQKVKKWLASLTGFGKYSKGRPLNTSRRVRHIKLWDRKTLWDKVFVAPVVCLPAVIVGLLLNILDALSYGMILFPLGSPIFSDLGSAGISIFYVSTIVAQLTFSFGSIFKGGVGSELIEVVPFFHSMAATITDIVGEDKPEAVIATTITSYALSSMLTGLVFYLMGQFKFGYIVGFIPRHILIGCIGGVGWFLVATGFEVTARMEGSFNYDLTTIHKLMQADTVPLWLIPLVLGLVLFYSHSRIASKYFLPLYIIAIPFVFYFFVMSLDNLDPNVLRDNGWIFHGPPPGEPWWYFYTLYQIDKVRWDAIVQCLPAMFALTFFGILHVPINVPALALNTGEDHADLDHELKLHGYSNFLSGALGSIQNYLVYANTLFFMRSGGDSRLAGIELAILTFGMMVVGPYLIGWIPVMMVGVLIFDLGFELLLEAVWQPRRKLKLLEYLTVIVIVLVMGIYDFVVGIGVGILMAFVSLIFQTSRVSAVRATYSGDVVGSTVRRNPSQQRYLRKAGRQIYIMKLAGYLFFGTIVSVEEKIRTLISDDAFRQQPIRFLILDLWQVTGLDYSAGEAFNTISRLLDGKGVHLVLSGVDAESELGHNLRAVGLGEDGIEVSLLPDLNSALELCENELLKIFYASQDAGVVQATPSLYLDLPERKDIPQPFDLLSSSPRRNHLRQVAQESLDQMDPVRVSRWQSFKEPLRLMLQIFHDLSDRNEDFWFRAVGYFTRLQYPAKTVLFHCGEPAEAFYLVERGILRAEYDLPQGWLCESIVAGTTCGELPFFSETDRTATAVVERDCVVWAMDRDGWARLQKEEPDVAQELLRISLKLTTERMSVITSYILTMAV